jgi:hypothetical protein
MLIHFSWSVWEVQATSPEPGLGITEHDAIPEELLLELLWNDTASLRYGLLRSKKRPS